MKNQQKIIIGVASTLLLLTIVGFALKPWFKKKFGNKGSSKNILLGLEEMNEDAVSATKPMGGWTITSTVDGSVICDYTNTGSNMEFPLSQSIFRYDNVANLQAYLLFTNPDINLCIDGYFGEITEAAVKQEVDGLGDVCTEWIDIEAGFEDSNCATWGGSYGYENKYFEDSETSSGAIDEDATKEQYNTITSEYYNDVITTELEYFTSEEDA